MKTRAGFTIIEVLMVIMIVSCIFGIAGSLLSIGFTSYFSSSPISTNASTANIAMANIMRELEGASNIASASATSITFVNSSGVTITISLSGGSLVRQAGAGTPQTICENISSAAFGYYDQTLATTAILANIRFITLQFTTANGNTNYPLMDGTLLRTML